MVLYFAIDIFSRIAIAGKYIGKNECTEGKYGEAPVFSAFLNDSDDKEYTSCFGYLFTQDEAQFTD